MARKIRLVSFLPASVKIIHLNHFLAVKIKDEMGDSLPLTGSPNLEVHESVLD
jgi:hypothetical protein